MKAEQLHEQTTKQLFNPGPTAKLAHQSPKKSKMTPHLSQNQKSYKSTSLGYSNLLATTIYHPQTLSGSQAQNGRGPKLCHGKATKLGTVENKSCSTTLVYLKTVFEPYTHARYSPSEAQKVNNNPTFKSKSKVINKGNIKIESCSIT